MAASNNPMMNIMYRDMLFNLSAGVLMPQDREILSMRPLPPDFVDPYTSKRCNALDAMQLTYNMLTVWIEETKTCDYFSKHFVDVSKQILTGVTTMGRGLMSLHLQGEDLSKAPMSIDDLIMVASYQLRKSYLGALQTMKRFPEASARLMANQINWTNLLLRLYKTEEKLAVGCRQLAVVDTVDSNQLPAASVNELQTLDAFSGTSAIGGVRALQPLENERSRYQKPEARENRDQSKAENCDCSQKNDKIEPEKTDLSKPITESEKLSEAESEISSIEDQETKIQETDTEHFTPSGNTEETDTATVIPPDSNEEAADDRITPSDNTEKTNSNSETNESQDIELTVEQMVALLENEEFCRQNPSTALQMQNILIQLYEDTYGVSFEDVVAELAEDPPPDRA